MFLVSDKPEFRRDQTLTAKHLSGCRLESSVKARRIRTYAEECVRFGPHFLAGVEVPLIGSKTLNFSSAPIFSLMRNF